MKSLAPLFRAPSSATPGLGTAGASSARAGKNPHTPLLPRFVAPVFFLSSPPGGRQEGSGGVKTGEISVERGDFRDSGCPAPVPVPPSGLFFSCDSPNNALAFPRGLRFSFMRVLYASFPVFFAPRNVACILYGRQDKQFVRQKLLWGFLVLHIAPSCPPIGGFPRLRRPADAGSVRRQTDGPPEIKSAGGALQGRVCPA